MKTQRGVVPSRREAKSAQSTARLQAVIYKEVKGLSKGLDLLKALNRYPGGLAFVTELAQTCSLHRTTTKRLLETLCLNNLVRRGELDGSYCLTFDVKSLSEGFHDDEWIDRVASPRMREAVPSLLWWCDLCTLSGSSMVVRESTHRWSNLAQERAMVGQRMPILTTSAGRAWLTWSPKAEREALLGLIAASRDEEACALTLDRKGVSRMISATHRRGYSVNAGEWSLYPHISAVAVPVISGNRLIAVLSLGFPVGAVTPVALKQRFLPHLNSLAVCIGKESRSWFE
jgi:IclR family transcriptional regulator, mhp operon transcriptional activator